MQSLCLAKDSPARPLDLSDPKSPLGFGSLMSVFKHAGARTSLWHDTRYRNYQPIAAAGVATERTCVVVSRELGR